MSDGSIKIIIDGTDDVLSVKDFLKIIRATVNALNTIAEGQEWAVGHFRTLVQRISSFFRGMIRATGEVDYIL